MRNKCVKLCKLCSIERKTICILGKLQLVSQAISTTGEIPQPAIDTSYCTAAHCVTGAVSTPTRLCTKLSSIELPMSTLYTAFTENQ